MRDTLVFVVCTVVLAGFLIYAFGAERREYAKRQLERQELCLNQAHESNFSPGICGSMRAQRSTPLPQYLLVMRS